MTKKKPATMKAKAAASKKKAAKKPAPARVKKDEAQGTGFDAGHEITNAGEARDAALFDTSPSSVGVAAPADLVKCRFCPTMIPRPEGTTVFECDEHVNFTGSFKTPNIRK